MINNILFICIGNICRSPMAEGLFKQAMPEKAVCSAGLHAMIGEPADPLSVQLMQERGIDISEHRARSLASWMVYEADLILTMDQYQKRFIEFKFPKAKGKIMRLGEHGNYDVPDPYQQNMAAFRHSSELIVRGVEQWVQHILDAEPEGQGTRYRALPSQIAILPSVP